MSYRWIDKRLLVLLHGESLSQHGGAAGMRDEGLLDSALARPLNVAAYGKPDLAELAAVYGVDLAKNHPFVDGNKRCAFLAVGLFLLLNGYRLTATPAEATLTIMSVAAGEISEADFVEWIRQHAAAR